MAVAELQVQGLSLHRCPIANAGDFQITAKALRDPLHQVLDARARGSPHRPCPLAIVDRGNDDITVFGGDPHVFGSPILQFAQLALAGDDQAFDLHVDAARYRNRILAHSRHNRKLPQNTRQRTSPPTLAARASWSAITPLGVERIMMPSPL